MSKFFREPQETTFKFGPVVNFFKDSLVFSEGSHLHFLNGQGHGKERMPSPPIHASPVADDFLCVLSFSHFSLVNESKPLFHFQLCSEYTHVSGNKELLVFSDTGTFYPKGFEIPLFDLKSEQFVFLSTNLPSFSRFEWHRTLPWKLYAFDPNVVSAIDTRANCLTNFIVADQGITCFEQLDTPTMFVYSTETELKLMDSRFAKSPLLVWSDFQHRKNPIEQLKSHGNSIWAMDSTDLTVFSFQESSGQQQLGTHPFCSFEQGKEIFVPDIPLEMNFETKLQFPSRPLDLLKPSRPCLSAFDIHVNSGQLKTAVVSSDGKVFLLEAEKDNDLFRYSNDAKLIFEPEETLLADKSAETTLLNIEPTLALFSSINSQSIQASNQEVHWEEFILSNDHFTAHTLYKHAKPHQVSVQDGTFQVKLSDAFAAPDAIDNRLKFDLTSYLNDSLQHNFDASNGMSAEIQLASHVYLKPLPVPENIPEAVQTILDQWNTSNIPIPVIEKRKRRRDAVRAFQEEKMEASQANIESFISTLPVKQETASLPFVLPTYPSSTPTSQPLRTGYMRQSFPVTPARGPPSTAKKRKKGF